MTVQAGDIDVRTLPHGSRHAHVISQVSALVPGEAVVVAAPHDPLRLLSEIQTEVHGAFSFDYLAAGPDLWRVAITRTECC